MMYRFFVFFAICLLWGCGGPRPLHVHPNAQDMEPTMQVFVAPKTFVDTRSQKALIQWANVPEDMPPAYSSGVLTRCIQNIFLQHRVFLVTALPDEKRLKGKDLAAFVSDNGFDYIIHANVPPMIIPAGNTPGWVGLDIRIENAKSCITVWHIYGEVNLVPEAGNYGIFRDRPSRPAPSAAQGFTSICRAAADIILGSNAKILVQ